jgi:hypothetical protein
VTDRHQINNNIHIRPAITGKKMDNNIGMILLISTALADIVSHFFLLIWDLKGLLGEQAIV